MIGDFKKILVEEKLVIHTRLWHVISHNRIVVTGHRNFGVFIFDWILSVVRNELLDPDVFQADIIFCI